MLDSMRDEKPETVGRYVLHAPIARGGMATVHAARLTGAEGFNRLVAAKRLHPEYVEDPDFTAMFHDEARIASRIHHPNVVPVLDVVVTEHEVMLVQEYVHGVPLSMLMRRARQQLKPVPTPIAVAIVAGVLAGLHAAHEAKDELGTPLDVIHRDVSPQNIMLSVDGVPRLLDFGIAKARSCAHQTRAGVVKGKLSYLSPEQIKLDPITRRVDLYAAGVVLWELLANRRVSEGMAEGDFLALLFDDAIPTLVEECSAWRRSMGQAGWKRLIEIDAIVTRAMSLKPAERYPTALEMAEALCAAQPPASQNELATWVAQTAGDHVEKLRRTLAESEERWRSEARVEVITLSRKASPSEDSGDRQTIPMPEHRTRALSAATLDEALLADLAAHAEANSDPPESLPAVERSALMPTPKRPRYVAWLAGAAAAAALAAVALHGTASDPPVVGAERSGVTVRTNGAASDPLLAPATPVVAPAEPAAATNASTNAGVSWSSDAVSPGAGSPGAGSPGSTALPPAPPMCPPASTVIVTVPKVTRAPSPPTAATAPPRKHPSRGF